MTSPFLPPLRLGFIGGGSTSAVGYTHFSSSHLDSLFQLEAGVFSRREAVNRASGRAYQVDENRVYPDWRALLDGERGRLDAISVLTPTPDHTDIVIAAIEAGFPVICEKSLATSSADCQRIGEAVSRHDGFLAVTFNYSGYPMVRELRELVQRGELGTLHHVEVEMPQEGFARHTATGEKPQPQPWRLSDYTVPTISLDLGSHVHHLVDFVTGGLKPLAVTAQQSSYGNFPAVVDNVNCLARYENGFSASIWYSKSALGYRNGLRLRLFGSEGSAEWLQTAPEQLQLGFADGRRMQLDLGAGNLRVASQPRYNRFKPGHPTGFIEAFANLYCDIAARLRARQAQTADSSPFVFGALHAEEGLQLLEAIDRAAHQQAWVDVLRPGLDQDTLRNTAP